MKKYRLDRSSVNVDGADNSGASRATSSRSRIVLLILVESVFDAIAERARTVFKTRGKNLELNIDARLIFFGMEYCYGRGHSFSIAITNP